MLIGLNGLCRILAPLILNYMLLWYFLLLFILIEDFLYLDFTEEWIYTLMEGIPTNVLRKREKTSKIFGSNPLHINITSNQ
ncbi:hypothetical protein I3760_06G032600 [Carya illinoinensis]|nr:hypothetical protein I3760_06G032600 [Carya illinoinensis]